MRWGEAMDREKVIADIEEQIAWIRDNDFHKFPGWGHAVLAMKDAISLLKEQEPVKPIEGDPVTQGFKYLCGKCHWKIVRNCIYCEHCGRSVKWE